jgi:protein-S-isoprenylcysteine O-methyltransferase Ste14
MLEARVPPPLVFLAAAALMWLLARLVPALAVPIPGRAWWAAACVAAGVVVGLLGVREFRKARTTVDPMRLDESSAVVVAGVYRITRNPMYAGLLLVLLGWAVFLANIAALIGPVAFVLYISRFQIVPEERALERKFGPPYLNYKQRVRRWL